jgi:hypothetical protein
MLRAACIRGAVPVRQRARPRRQPDARIEEDSGLRHRAKRTAEIDLWCNSVKAQLVIAASTITIITGEMSSRQCPPARARADDDLLTALNQVTNWQMDDSALVLTGGRTLRFLRQTN